MLGLFKSGKFDFKKLIKTRIPLMAMLFIAAICAGILFSGAVNTFTVSVGGKTQKIYTLSKDVDSAVNLAGFNSNKYKVLRVNTTDNATHIDLAYTFPVYITTGDKTVEVASVKTTVADVLKEAGYTVDEFDMVEPSLDTVITDTIYIDYTNIDYVTGTYTEAIPHTVVTEYSNKVEEGTTNVTAGVDGEQQVNYTEKLVNGVKVETVINDCITLSAPVDGVEVVGTKKPVVTTSESVNTISTLPAPEIELDANGNPVSFKEKLTVQATAYTYTGNNCSTGVAPQPGYIAVNPNYIPYGTKMYIKTADGSYIYGYAVAADTGGFIKSRPTNVDLFMASRAACVSFGRRNVEIYILE